MLINRDFTLLWIGQTVSLVGTLLFDTTLMLWVATDLLAGTRYAPLASTAIPVIAAVIALSVGPAAGVFVDRHDKRRTMIQADVFRTCLLLAFVAVLWLPRAAFGIPTLLGVTCLTVALNSAGAQYFGPARSVLLGDVLPAAERGKAAGYRQATDALGAIFGPTMAAPLLIALGPRWAVTANALSFAVSAWCARLVRPPLRHRQATTRQSTRREFVVGLRAVSATPMLKAIVVTIAIALLGAGTLSVIDVYFLTDNLGASRAWFGLLSGVFGVGILVGSLVCGRFGDRIGHRRVFSYGMLTLGCLLALYAKQTSLAPALATITVFGLTLGAINTSIMPIVLGAVPRDVQGRVWSVFGISNQTATLASMAAGGLLAAVLPKNLHFDVLGVSFGRLDTIFFSAGIIVLIGGCYACRAMRRPETTPGEVAGAIDRPLSDAKS